MSIETILARLDRVTQKTESEHRASCPTDAHKHGDRSAGLCITVSADGKTLLYCPAGCTADEITAALGLQLADLFPPKPQYAAGSRGRNALPRWRRERLQDALELEYLVWGIWRADLAAGTPISQEDAERVILAERRLWAIVGVFICAAS